MITLFTRITKENAIEVVGIYFLTSTGRFGNGCLHVSISFKNFYFLKFKRTVHCHCQILDFGNQWHRRFRSFSLNFKKNLISERKY